MLIHVCLKVDGNSTQCADIDGVWLSTLHVNSHILSVRTCQYTVSVFKCKTNWNNHRNKCVWDFRKVLSVNTGTHINYYYSYSIILLLSPPENITIVFWQLFTHYFIYERHISTSLIAYIITDKLHLGGIHYSSTIPWYKFRRYIT